MKDVRYAKNSAELEKIIARGLTESSGVAPAVEKIIDDIRAGGDRALFDYTKRFDKYNLSAKNVRVSKNEIRAAVARADKKLLNALNSAAKNIAKFHRIQLSKAKASWRTQTTKGVFVGEKTAPIESVGCYVPGGRAAYPSTVLMTALVAKVAGVKRVVVVSPPPIPNAIAAACGICGVDEVYQVGGAQAVAALAYGTKTIKRVGKIVGPGNKYVTEAKRQVYGAVDVDMPAGPSEVLIIADDSANPSFIAADLLAQAEHDPDARCVLATPSRKLAAEVKKEITKQVKKLPRKSVIKSSLSNAVVILTKNIGEAVSFANDYAPEHLEVITKNPRKIAEKIKNAGAIFIGPYSPVAMGDYASGGNHVLPTGGAARFSSPLSVRDFLKTSCVQEASENGLRQLSEIVNSIAESEGLTAHRRSVERRIQRESR